MARFEVTLSNGEKLVAEHGCEAIADLMAEVETKAYLLMVEIKPGVQTPPKEIMVATRQLTLIRSLDAGSMQGSNFRAKR